jgi:hypothetical protein
MRRIPVPVARAATIAATLSASLSSSRRRPSWLPSALARLRPAHDPLANHRAFELGKHTQHLEHRSAGRRRRVEALLVQEQVDALGVEFAEEVQQVDQGPTKAVNRPGRDHVDGAAGNGLEQAIKARGGIVNAVLVVRPIVARVLLAGHQAAAYRC